MAWSAANGASNRAVVKAMMVCRVVLFIDADSPLLVDREPWRSWYLADPLAPIITTRKTVSQIIAS